MLFHAVITFCAITASLAQSFDSPALDWVEKDESGAYQFGYATGDEGKHYHVSSATANNQVTGRFGYKDPVTGGDLQTVYTAGRKGFRARGPHIARRMDLSQNRPPYARPNNDGKYIPELDNVFDPNEDRGYDFSYRTPTHFKEEHADRAGDVQGRYSYVDDVGNSHAVDYIAGSKTGFVVTNAVPDTFARARGGPLYFVGKRPGPKIRGFHAIQKALDGSYRFEASGPDHKRSEVSDSLGNRRGTYTYLDDKGVQHTVEYIAGPNIGYKVINNKKGTLYNPMLPLYPDSPLTPLLPPFPTTTFRPISGPGFGGSASTSGSSFSAKPTESTKIPGGSGSTQFSGPESSFPSSTTSPHLPDTYGPSPKPTTETEATKFPAGAKPTTESALGGTDDKWDYGHGGSKPQHPKDWSVKPDPGKKPRPGIPSDFPFFKPTYPGDGFVSFFEDGLNTAESGHPGKPQPSECGVNGTKEHGGAFGATRGPKSHYRGSIKYGGIRRSGEDKEKREYLEIPAGVAVRAHVQSLDILPLNKRFASPGEALEAFSGTKTNPPTSS